MAKKIKGPVILNLRSEHAGPRRPEMEIFCRVWEHDKKECAFGIPVIADEKYYNLLYQNGKFLGLVQPNGGTVYPFSRNPYKKGSRFGNRKIHHAQVVCISKAQNLEMLWGTRSPILVYDRDGKPYHFGANGSFYVEIEPADLAKNADCFFRKILVSADEEGMTVLAVRDKLKAAFVNVIGAKIQEVLEEMNRPLSQLVGLTPKEKLEISGRVYQKLRDIFAEYGLTITSASKNSIIDRLIVRADGIPQAEPQPPVNPPRKHFSPAMW